MICEEINWQAYAEIAYGLLGWSPQEFWAATPQDFWIAYGGWQKRHGTMGSHMQPLNRAELDQLIKIQH